MHRIDDITATQGGFSQSGDTNIGSGLIDNIASTVGISAGDYVTISDGFSPAGIRILVTGVGTSDISVNRNAVASVVGVTVTSQPNMFTEGDPERGIAATIVRSRLVNSIQDELVNLVQGAGISLDLSDNSQVFQAINSLATGGLDRGYISGLEMDVYPGDSENKSIGIHDGGARIDSIYTINETFGPSGFLKQVINNARDDFESWVTGSGNGGVASAVTIGDKWLNVFVMYNKDTLAFDFGLDTSVIGSNLSTSSWRVRRIGSIYVYDTGGSVYEVREFIQDGDNFTLDNITAKDTGGLINSTYTNAPVLVPLTLVPLGVRVLAHITARAVLTAGTDLTINILSSNDTNDLASKTLLHGTLFLSGTSPQFNSISLLTDTSGQIKTVYTSTGAVVGTISFSVTGYVDNRGKA